MTGLYRMKPTGVTRRPLARNHEEAARAQAYILRDLIEHHSGIRIAGGDVTDTFALAYHAMDWAKLMIGRTSPTTERYYATLTRENSATRATVLRQLVPGLGQASVRVALEMPAARYSHCRTIDGAHLATLLAGRPSWHLPDYYLDETLGSQTPVIFDARSDRGYVPRGFSSDPLTNAEYVLGHDLVRGEEVRIPVSDVRYIRRNCVEGMHDQDGVVLQQALSQPLARRWLDAGNSLSVLLFKGNRNLAKLCLEPVKLEASTDIELAIRNLYGSPDYDHVVVLPVGLSEVRDPNERWKPMFRHSRAILSAVEMADARYQQALDRISMATSGEQAKAIIREATSTYNETLALALKAFWRDTQEINSWKALAQAYMTRDPDNELCFSGVSPLQVFRGLIQCEAE